MKLSRRHLAALGALALGAPALIGSAHAQSADEATVKKAVEELRTALIKQDKAKLELLTAEQLSYSHSDARLQNKAELIDGVMTQRARRQGHQHQNRRHAGMAETGRRLEAAGACVLEAATAGIAPRWLASTGPPRHSSAVYVCATPLGSGILSGEQVERQLAAILAADVRGFAFNAWASHRPAPETFRMKTCSALQRLNARCPFSQRTFSGAHGNDGVAPGP
jgi:hypothetical protein